MMGIVGFWMNEKVTKNSMRERRKLCVITRPPLDKMTKRHVGKCSLKIGSGFGISTIMFILIYYYFFAVV
jgi:hypothetical protein